MRLSRLRAHLLRLRESTRLMLVCSVPVGLSIVLFYVAKETPGPGGDKLYYAALAVTAVTLVCVCCTIVARRVRDVEQQSEGALADFSVRIRGVERQLDEVFERGTRSLEDEIAREPRKSTRYAKRRGVTELHPQGTS